MRDTIFPLTQVFPVGHWQHLVFKFSSFDFLNVAFDLQQHIDWRDYGGYLKTSAHLTVVLHLWRVVRWDEV